MKPIKVSKKPHTKMTQSNIKKTNGLMHRKCVLRIPKQYSDHYPDDQVFEVQRIGNSLMFVPVTEIAPEWQYKNLN